ITKEEWGEYFSSHWHFNGVKQYEHIAMFPEELPKRLIKMFSFAGETVLDPFAGSGTTSLAAKHLGRNSIGYEINRSFAPIIRSKLCEPQLSFSEEESQVFFSEDRVGNTATFDRLPYIFRDPHRMDKKIDVKKLQFGSSIDGSSTKRDDLFSVKRVISPERIELSNGLIVKLLGVKESKSHAQEAVDFLKGKFQKRKVFLRYDSVKYDSENNLLCYVYLDNKTFINNHLIRTGFVDVDVSLDYSCKSKFLNSVQV
ncbi:MAG: thermonuclease family protein, partial [Clostridia bacterium]|nr:thermonuclease family protein [Clostridia bacterium]